MGNLGLPPHIIEQVLNHQTGSKIANIYNKSTYQSEKRAALDRWADHLMAVIENRQSNVMSLKRA